MALHADLLAVVPTQGGQLVPALVPCGGGCGKQITYNKARGSLDNPICRACRRQRRDSAPPCRTCNGRMSDAWCRLWVNGQASAPGQCRVCWLADKDAIRRTGKRPCRACGAYKPLSAYQADKRWRDGEGLGSAVCRACQWDMRPKEPRRINNQVTSRRRRAAERETWDGIPDREIYERDGWTCQIPRCLRPEGRAIDRQLVYPDPWYREIDHIVPIVHGGPDIAPNKRAAHSACNGSRGDRVDEADAPWVAGLGDLSTLYERAKLAAQERTAGAHGSTASIEIPGNDTGE